MRGGVARPGQAISNPLTGERIAFRRTAADTGGELLEFDLELRPGGVVAGAPHRHRHTEHFEVTAGRLAGWIAGEGRVSAGPDEEVTVPSWRDHFLGNGALATTRARVTVRPAGRFERVFEVFFALASGRRPPGQRSRLAAVRELLRLMREEAIVMAGVPSGAQRAVLGVLSGGAGPWAREDAPPGPAPRRRPARSASRGKGSPRSARPD